MRARKDVRDCDTTLALLGETIDACEANARAPVVAIRLPSATYWGCWRAFCGHITKADRGQVYSEFAYRGVTIVLSREIPAGQHCVVTLNDWGTAHVPRRRSA